MEKQIKTSGGENPAFILAQHYPLTGNIENIRYNGVPLRLVKDIFSVGMWRIKYKRHVTAA